MHVVPESKEDAGLDESRNPPVSIAEWMDGDQEKMRQQRADDGMMRFDAAGVDETQVVFHQDGQSFVGSPAVDSAEVRRSHGYGMAPEFSGDVVRYVRVSGNHPMHGRYVFQANRRAVRKEPSFHPSLCLLGVPDLQLLFRKNPSVLDSVFRLGTALHLSSDLCLGEGVALDRGRSVNGTHSIQPVELSLPLRRNHEVQGRLLICLDGDERIEKLIRSETIFECERFPVHGCHLS